MFTSDVEGNLDLKIIDLGDACRFDPGKGMWEPVGSPLFMAPELVNNETYSEKVDIWAVGMITYLLVSGT